jgi:hypothetical protein
VGVEKPKKNRMLWGIVTLWAMMELIGIETLLAWLFRTLSEEIRVK